MKTKPGDLERVEISVCAFADDLVIIAKKESDLQQRCLHG